mmetsp:Transcript_28336/g.34643  ORF Transcript_28336/g.34643 Transcript_28336/m.34643 type:complete len:228 (-) Transcript_28336:18-701(-)
MPIRNCHCTDGANMPRQGQFQRSTGQIPNLNQAVITRGREPFVCGVHCNCPHPTFMSRHHSHQLPWWMPNRLWNLRTLSKWPDLNLRGRISSNFGYQRHHWPNCRTRFLASLAAICQHLRDCRRQCLSGSIISRCAAQEWQRCVLVCNLLWNIPDMLVLIMHLHSEHHLCASSILNTLELFISDEEVVRSFQRLPDCQGNWRSLTWAQRICLSDGCRHLFPTQSPQS